MKPTRWQRIERLFHEALSRTPAERAQFLAEACADDAELLAELTRLLAAHEDSSFLEAPALEAAARDLARDQVTALMPHRLGPYEVRGLLGVGGMGMVYRARDTTLCRDVALKVVPDVFARDPHRFARFEREAQALAALNHPNIGQIYGVEESDTVRALVLELVEGPTLAELIARRSPAAGLAGQSPAAGLQSPAARLQSPAASLRSPVATTLETGDRRPETASNRQGLPLDEALPIATQIAEALEAAHEQRIVHRDLKPSNIKFTAKGYVKVLDFGLAKALDRDPGAGAAGTTRAGNTQNARAGESTGGRFLDSSNVTLTGTTLGTVAYMSPEQTRGQHVDHRSDLWSFGVVLYEMLAGRRPFPGHDVASVLQAIRTVPYLPLTDLQPNVPGSVLRIVDRALDKRVESRYQSASELLADLRHATTTSGATTAPPDPSLRRPAVPAVLAVLGGVAVVALTIVGDDRGSSSSSGARLANAEQLTSATGLEGTPEWSPDGLTLAYSATATGTSFGGNWDIWVARAGTPPVNRTEDHVGSDRYPAWSPDGTRLAFWSDRDGPGYYVMPWNSGQARRVGTTRLGSYAWSYSRPQWSSDGTNLAYVTYETGVPLLEIVNVADNLGEHTERTTTLLERKTRRLPGRQAGRASLSWSPDRRLMAYVAAVNGTIGTETHQLWVIDLDTDAAHGLTDGRSQVLSPSWDPDGDAVYFVSNSPGSRDLFRQAIEPNGAKQGPPVQISAGVGMRYASVSADGRRLAYSQGRMVDNVWRVPILTDRRATWDDAEQLTFDQARVEFLSISADGRHLLLDSDRGGNLDLWSLALATGDMRQLTFDSGPDWGPASSPDGRSVAFYSLRSGNRDIWIMPAEGGRPRQLTKHPGGDFVPAWSPDGREIAFASDRSGNFDIWIVPASGGTPRQLTARSGTQAYPQWASDGLSVLFSSWEHGPQVWRIPSVGGQAEPLIGGPGSHGHVSTDDRSVYFLGQGERAGNLWVASMVDGTERPLTDFRDRLGNMRTEGLATDGTHLYFTWGRDLGDIWLADLVQPNE